jgi:hypothetical protein
MQGCIYIPGVYFVFVLENLGRDNELFGLPLYLVSHFIFIILFILVTIKVLIRKRIYQLVVSPFEYLIMLVVLSVPLLPLAISGEFHLLTVAAKSVVLFVGFKLILMRQIQRNRKFVLVIAGSALILVLRSILEF